MILLYCQHENGQTGFQAGIVEGYQVEDRRYEISNHFVAVEHEYEAVAAADARHLLTHPLPDASIFRLATPEEQDEYAASQGKKGSLREAKTAKAGG